MTLPARGTLLIGAGGVLAMTAIFDAATEGMPGAGAWEHDRLALLSPLHLLALASVLLSLWPAALDFWSAARHRRLHWAIVGLITTAVAFVRLGPMAAALCAFTWSAGSFLRVRSRQSHSVSAGTGPQSGA